MTPRRHHAQPEPAGRRVRGPSRVRAARRSPRRGRRRGLVLALGAAFVGALLAASVVLVDPVSGGSGPLAGAAPALGLQDPDPPSTVAAAPVDPVAPPSARSGTAS